MPLTSPPSRILPISFPDSNRDRLMLEQRRAMTDQLNMESRNVGNPKKELFEQHTNPPLNSQLQETDFNGNPQQPSASLNPSSQRDFNLLADRRRAHDRL